MNRAQNITVRLPISQNEYISNFIQIAVYTTCIVQVWSTVVLLRYTQLQHSTHTRCHTYTFLRKEQSHVLTQPHTTATLYQYNALSIVLYLTRILYIQAHTHIYYTKANTFLQYTLALPFSTVYDTLFIPFFFIVYRHYTTLHCPVLSHE